MLDTLTTDKNGHAESKELPICTYNEDGSFKEDIHYTVVETKAADGYILDETAHDVTLRYDDNAPDVVVTTLKLINVPTEPKLPQTGDNANPLLYLGKVNVTLDGIILREEGRNISPTIYINDMYKKYQDCGDLEVSHH